MFGKEVKRVDGGLVKEGLCREPKKEGSRGWEQVVGVH